MTDFSTIKLIIICYYWKLSTDLNYSTLEIIEISWHDSCRCQYCSKTFTRKEHMVNHVRKHTGETPHRCDICKKSFTRKEHFMNHVMWHTGETPHHCQACGKKYTRKEHLANHMRSHTNDTPFRCEICGKWYNLLCFSAHNLNVSYLCLKIQVKKDLCCLYKI